MEVRTRRRHIGLARYFPSAVWSHELVRLFTLELSTHTSSAMGKIVRPQMLLKVLRWV
jgi:hypothetical protein